MAIRWKVAPKATSLKTRAFNKAVGTERKFNTAMNAFSRAKDGSRTQRIADWALRRLTPSKDVRRATQLWNSYSEIRRVASGRWKMIGRK